MIKLSFFGEVDALRRGIEILSEDYGFRFADGGIPVEVKSGTALSVDFDGKAVRIEYSRPCEFFRALGLFLQKYSEEKKPFSVKETSHFDTCGAMVDLSHGALLTVDAIKSVLRKMAMMGLNMFMLYREESYYVPGYKYFGYMRGRHTDAEIKEIDDYAYALGIEIIPAIQTLGHLANTLHWFEFASVKDTEDCLLVGEEKTYEFIEAMLKAAKGPLRSNRIHIGFDETMSLGMGNYISKHGYRPRLDIFMEHLARVAEIAKALGLEPMVWSDMFLRTKGSTVSYASDTNEIPKEIAFRIPENIQIVPGSYGLKDPAVCREKFEMYMKTGRTLWIAGAVHDWHGFCVGYYHTVDATNAQLTACKQLGLKNVFATTWGDDSTERDFFCNLLGFQLYAEHMYREKPRFADVVKRFDFCGKCSGDLILEISNIDNPHGYPLISDDYKIFTEVACGKKNASQGAEDSEEAKLVFDSAGKLVNPSKYLMWQDPLQGLFDVDAKKVDFRAHFSCQREKISRYLGKFPEYESTLRFYISLCDVLAEKADLGVRMKKFYDEGNAAALASIAKKDIPALLEKLDTMWKANRTLWFERHHAFGFDVLERRYGALSMRLKTAAYRIEEYLGGRIERIEELEEERLSAKPESPEVAYHNDYLWTSTAWGR